nr:FHA domain-containing protein [uncultured Pseudomonas sp.]
MTALISLTSFTGSLAPQASVPVLSIIHGLHSGVTLALDKPSYIIGSAGATDLRLSDTGIAERHLVLQFASGLVTIEARGGDVLVIGRHRPLHIPLGSGHRARLPLTLHIGTAQLVLSDAAEGQAVRTQAPACRRPRRAGWAIAVGLVCICAAAFAWRASPPSPVNQSAASSLPQPALEQASAPVPSSQANEVVQAKRWLEQQLATAGFAHLNVSQRDGQLAVQGSYDAQRKRQWIDLQQAFDSRFGQRIMLRLNARPRAEISAPKVRLQAVWFGTDPYVVNEAGKRLYPGAALVDDWTLEKIENNQVILARGEERFTFKL